MKLIRLLKKININLLEERSRLKEIDPYGNENLDKWFENPPINQNLVIKNTIEGSTKFKKGIPYLWLRVIMRNFESIELYFQKQNYYKIKNPLIEDEIFDIKRKLKSNE